MFGFFRSSVECPVAPEEQRWIDGRFQWLREQFEDACKTCEVILPTPEFFPDRYEGKAEDVQPMLARISAAMGVDAGRFKLFFYSERNPFQGRLSGHYTSHGSA